MSNLGRDHYRKLARRMESLGAPRAALVLETSHNKSENPSMNREKFRRAVASVGGTDERSAQQRALVKHQERAGVARQPRGAQGERR